MAEHDILIRDGTVLDVTRLPCYCGDIAIKGGRIVQNGQCTGATAVRHRRHGRQSGVQVAR